MFTSAKRPLLTQLSAISFITLLAMPCLAQSPKVTWKEAIKLIDSTSSADVLAATNMLKQSASAKEPLPLAGRLALALHQLRQPDVPGAKVTLQELDKLTTDQAGPLNGLRLRAKLYAALASEDASAAETAFKDLVRHVVRGSADPVDMRAAAHTVGAAVGMLELEEARSPLVKRVLDIGTNCMVTSKTRGVGFAYELAYAQAHERAAAIANNLALIERDGLVVLQAEYTKRLESLKKRQAELAEQKELNSEVARNSREQIDQNTVDLRQLTREISKINNDLRRPTPGHPGIKQPAPPAPPPRSSIRVPEYETRTEYEYVTQNGQQVRVPVTRQERRPQSEIDRDRDREYNALMGQYNAVMREYRAYETRYIEDMRTWTANDQLRRQDLSKRKAEAEAQREDLVRANKEISEEKRDYAKELRLKRTAEEQEDFDLQMLQAALEATVAGKPESAFRPANFDFINWSQEKLILQK